MISRKRGLFSVLALLVAALALVAAGCGGDDESSGTVVPTTEATGGGGRRRGAAVVLVHRDRVQGRRDPDVLHRVRLPAAGLVAHPDDADRGGDPLPPRSSRTTRPATTTSPTSRATTRPPRPASGTRASARRTPTPTPPTRRSIGVIGTFNSGCAAIEIPVLNQAPGGGVAMISPANTYVCLTEGGPGCDATEPDKYYPSGTRNYARVVAHDAYQGAAVAEFAKAAGRQERLHPERQGGLWPRRRDELPERCGDVGIKVAGLRGLGSEGVELRGAVQEDQGDRGRRSLPRRPDRRERRPGDQGQGRRARPERRRGQAVRAGRVHDAADDRRGPRGRAGHVPGVAGVPIDEFQGKGAEFADCFKPRLGGKEIDPYAIYGAQAAQVMLDAIAASDGSRADVIAKMFAPNVTDGISAPSRSTRTAIRAAPRVRSSASRSTRRRTSSRPSRRSLRSRRTSRRRAARTLVRTSTSRGRALPSPDFRFRFSPSWRQPD